MRLILPTGDGGAERAYPMDGLLDLGRLTLNETIELRRVTGLDLTAMWRGFAMLDEVLGVPNETLLASLSQHLELMEAYRALVWLCRHRAGDRAEDDSVLTVEQAVDFPFAGLHVEADPGDAADDEPPDPHQRPTGGGRAAGRGKPRPAGRSSRTSAGKS